MQTNVPGIYATGDVVGQPMLAHKASHEGEVVAEVIAGKKTVNDARVIPAVVFTEPEIASAGLSETEAKESGREFRIGKFPFAASGRAMAIADTTGFVKILADAEDDRILGVHIVGPEASDLISEAALAIEMGAYTPDLALTIHPHPTLSEAVMEAAKHAMGEAIHIQNRK
jgi:dihydrolipoamide dehydrogenase